MFSPPETQTKGYGFLTLLTRMQKMREYILNLGAVTGTVQAV